MSISVAGATPCQGSLPPTSEGISPALLTVRVLQPLHLHWSLACLLKPPHLSLLLRRHLLSSQLSKLLSLRRRCALLCSLHHVQPGWLSLRLMIWTRLFNDDVQT